MDNPKVLPLPEEWAAWKDHEVTRVFFAFIFHSREDKKEMMAQGLRDPSEVIPQCKLAQEILDVKLEDILDFYNEQ